MDAAGRIRRFDWLDCVSFIGLDAVRDGLLGRDIAVAGRKGLMLADWHWAIPWRQPRRWTIWKAPNDRTFFDFAT